MRKSSTPNSKNVKAMTRKQREKLLDALQPQLKTVVRDGIDQYIGESTKLMLQLLMLAEAQELCGKPYERSGKRQMVRWGEEKKGTAVISGVKTSIARPRVRMNRGLEVESQEVHLETYKAMNRADLLDGPLVAAIMSGVSARRYASIVARGLEAKGIKRNTVSRRAIAATKPTVDEFIHRSLAEHDFIVILIDGVHVAHRQVVCAIGIDNNGRKHVLGIKVGATENEIVCRDLIRDLIERGVSSGKRYLFVIDGSRALARAIRAAFGQNTQIQRCQEHKIRDVQGYLPVKMRQEYRDKMQAAYNERTERKAYARLMRIRFELSLISENAVNSLTEGLAETLTLHRLNIVGMLRQSLRTTNIIESAFSSVRRYMGRVTMFHDEAQRELWVMRSLIEAERHFRPLRGSRQLAKLRAALEQEGISNV